MPYIFLSLQMMMNTMQQPHQQLQQQPQQFHDDRNIFSNFSSFTQY